MASFEPVDIDYVEIGEEGDNWNDDFVNDLEVRFNRLRKFNETLNESTDEDTIDMTAKTKYALKHDTIELVANKIYDRLTILFNNDRKRFDIQKGELVLNPIRKYENFKLADDGALTFVDKRTLIDLGNINERLKSPSEIRRIGVKKLKMMGFVNITDEDANPYKQKYKRR